MNTTQHLSELNKNIYFWVFVEVFCVWRKIHTCSTKSSLCPMLHTFLYIFANIIFYLHSLKLTQHTEHGWLEDYFPLGKAYFQVRKMLLPGREVTAIKACRSSLRILAIMSSRSCTWEKNTGRAGQVDDMFVY